MKTLSGHVTVAWAGRLSPSAVAACSRTTYMGRPAMAMNEPTKSRLPFGLLVLGRAVYPFIRPWMRQCRSSPVDRRCETVSGNLWAAGSSVADRGHRRAGHRRRTSHTDRSIPSDRGAPREIPSALGTRVGADLNPRVPPGTGLGVRREL